MLKEKKENNEKALEAYKVPSSSKVSALTNSVSDVIAKVKALKITSAKKFEEAETLRSSVKAAIKKIESLYEDSLAEVKKAKASIESVRKTIVSKQASLTAPFEEALKELNMKLIAFQNEEEERLFKLEEIARKAKEAKSPKAKEKLLSELPKIKTTENRASLSSGSFIDNWKAEVTDFSLLPDEYKIVDQVALNKAAKELKDSFNIPGAKAVNEKFIR